MMLPCSGPLIRGEPGERVIPDSRRHGEPDRKPYAVCAAAVYAGGAARRPLTP
jgi:hypothetical protein